MQACIGRVFGTFADRSRRVTTDGDPLFASPCAPAARTGPAMSPGLLHPVGGCGWITVVGETSTRRGARQGASVAQGATGPAPDWPDQRGLSRNARADDREETPDRQSDVQSESANPQWRPAARLRRATAISHAERNASLPRVAVARRTGGGAPGGSGAPWRTPGTGSSPSLASEWAVPATMCKAVTTMSCARPVIAMACAWAAHG